MAEADEDMIPGQVCGTVKKIFKEIKLKGIEIYGPEELEN